MIAIVITNVIFFTVLLQKGVIMQSLKITTIGNSAGVILPREVLEKLRVSKGDVIYLVEDQDGYRITPYDEAFVEQMEAAEEIMREDRDVLKVLSK